jgi:hypothetical protein
MLRICTSNVSSCPDFPKILNLLKEKNITFNIVTNDDAVADSYDLLTSANTQALQVDFTTDNGNVNPIVKKFIECRKGKECKIPLYISLVHPPRTSELPALESLELGEQDKIILPNSSDSDIIVLNKMGLLKHVLNKTDNDTSCLQIGLDCLAGKTLEQAPPNIV